MRQPCSDKALHDHRHAELTSDMKKLKTIEMQRLSVEEFHAAEKMPLVVVLDDVRSLYNVGSVFRTGDAFRIESVYLCGITVKPDTCSDSALRELHKTALGAEDSVDWKYFPTAMEAVNDLKANGYEVLAVEQCHGSKMLNDFTPEAGKRYAVILGNEVKGVHQEVIDACDGCLEIPQYGTKHSLNVSVTAGIIIWKFRL